jgi:hypothetical protein
MAGLLKKYVKKSIKMSFFEVMSKVQKDSENISSGIGIEKKKVTL